MKLIFCKMYWILTFYMAGWHVNAAEDFISGQLPLRTIESSFKPTESIKKRCILPPYPENGGYVVLDKPNAGPGNVFEKVSFIQYKTSDDDQLIEIKNFKCTHGHWSLKIFKYESEKIYLNSSWCRLMQSKPLIQQWTAPFADRSSANSGMAQKYTQQAEMCTLPPQPVDGSYEVVNRPGAKPGEILDAVHLIYSCNSILTLVGNKDVYCFNNVWSSKAPLCYRCGAVHSLGGTRGRGGYAGGIDATLWELPWQVALYDKDFTPYKQICGGSIVASNLVISAAHCVWNDSEKLRSAQRFAVAAGKVYRAWDQPLDEYAQKSDVSEIKIPPRFRGAQTNFQDDIALLFLAPPFSYGLFVAPICLDFDPIFDAQQLTPGKLGKVAGWGLITESGKETQKLQTGWLPNVDIDECVTDAAPDFRVYITSDKICAGYTNGSALCRGDSGGGIAFPEGEKKEDTVFYLRGVISIAPVNDKACNVHAITSFTHILPHQYFIKDNLDKALF